MAFSTGSRRTSALCQRLAAGLHSIPAGPTARSSCPWVMPGHSTRPVDSLLARIRNSLSDRTLLRAHAHLEWAHRRCWLRCRPPAASLLARWPLPGSRPWLTGFGGSGRAVTLSSNDQSNWRRSQGMATPERRVQEGAKFLPSTASIDRSELCFLTHICPSVCRSNKRTTLIAPSQATPTPLYSGGSRQAATPASRSLMAATHRC